MILTSIAFGLLAGWALGASWWAWRQNRAWQRTYDYAVERADLTERGFAYSDMATVLVLALDDPWPLAGRQDRLLAERDLA